MREKESGGGDEIRKLISHISWTLFILRHIPNQCHVFLEDPMIYAVIEYNVDFVIVRQKANV